MNDTYDSYATGSIVGARQAGLADGGRSGRGKLAAAGDDTPVEREAAAPDAPPSRARPGRDMHGGNDVAGIAAGQLRSLVERIERLADEKASIADDIKQVYGEAKAHGFDTKVLRIVIRLRKQDAAEREEQDAILDLYKHALGMV